VGALCRQRERGSDARPDDQRIRHPNRHAGAQPDADPDADRSPTIGEPADDGARIIAVQTNPLYGPVPVTRARDITIDSPAVGIVQVQLLLPSRFDAQPEKRWPALYVLGGSSGTHRSWTQQTDIEALTAPEDLLVVIPDQGAEIGGGGYADWWNGGKGGPQMWETFHVVELPQLLERNWHVGDGRAIEGPSSGGLGAIGYAERHPGMFLFVGSWSAPGPEWPNLLP
ncbi:MAG TPA: alpha/beta hydrolase-fold protein, partial [Candidatus Limnocylindrales bacterium]|nr:alpha/beta hydrolase-fold protein [Candidatus Limnocylindrales bacterium]